MNTREITVFDAENLPTETDWRQIYALFENTVLVFDEQSETDNQKTLEKRDSLEKLRDLMTSEQKTTVLAIRNERQRIVALLEWDQREVPEDILLAYITWMLVAKEAKGQKLASLLHKHFEGSSIPTLQKTTKRTVIQALSFHNNNPAGDIYKHWGYTKEGAPQFEGGRTVTMMKIPPAIKPDRPTFSDLLRTIRQGLSVPHC